MDYLTAIFLGVVQGFTEFLPVSSSGHLVIVQSLIPGFDSPGILLEVILHAGTLSAVIYYFRDKLLELDKEYLFAIFIATLPAVFVGLFFKDQIEVLFNSITIVGYALLLTSLFNFFTDKFRSRERTLGYSNSLIIGIFQAFAIIPGISRSGSTIFAGSKTGLDKKEAAEFSFLLSIPAILGANFLELLTYDSSLSINISAVVFGFIAAFISGLVAIKFTIRFLTNNNFKYFAFYTAVLGIIIILM